MDNSKKLSDDKYRVIKIGREAMFEFIHEKIIDNQEDFFNIPDITKITSHFEIDWDTGEFIALIHNYDEDNVKSLQLPESICLKKLMHNMSDTTTTMFAANRYVELSIDEIVEIQSKCV